jgi:hypothetical protein
LIALLSRATAAALLAATWDFAAIGSNDDYGAGLAGRGALAIRRPLELD